MYALLQSINKVLYTYPHGQKTWVQKSDPIACVEETSTAISIKCTAKRIITVWPVICVNVLFK